MDDVSYSQWLLRNMKRSQFDKNKIVLRGSGDQIYCFSFEYLEASIKGL